MFKQFDLYLPSNHKEPTKEIHDMQFGKCVRKGCVISGDESSDANFKTMAIVQHLQN